MMKQLQRPQVEVLEESWQLTLQGETVLACWLTQPRLTGRGRGVQAINRYYRRVAERWKRRWNRELYLQACLDLARCAAEGTAFRPWQAAVDTCVTLDDGEVFSLWQEGRERQGKRPEFLARRGDSWRVRTGAPVTLAEVFRGEKRWRRWVLEQVARQVERRQKDGQSLLFPNCAELAKKQFDPERFWLEEDHVQIFYQPEVLGSRVEGVIAVPISVPGRE